MILPSIEEHNMSKRCILLLTYNDPEGEGDEQVAVVIGATKAKALKRMKQIAAEKFAEGEKARGDGDSEYKLGPYIKGGALRKHKCGEVMGYFTIIAKDNGGVCEDRYVVSDVPYAEVQ